MVMSRKTFDTLHAGYSIAITGRQSDPADVRRDYKAMRTIADFTGATDVVPIFFRGKGGKLDMDVQPVRFRAAVPPPAPAG